MKLGLVLSCEHGGNRVPAAYRKVFANKRRLLDSHAGWDAGAAVLAKQIQRTCNAPLTLSTTTRLLADLNRSETHPKVLAPWIRALGSEQCEAILERYWRPHRRAVEDSVRACPRGSVLHLSVHSFTPRWEGKLRDVDIGLLYDPTRQRERSFVDAWLRELAARRPDLRLRRNRPYRGTSDGLTTHLRGQFSAARYLGVEIEVSQRFPLGDARPWTRLRKDLVESFCGVMDR